MTYHVPRPLFVKWNRLVNSALMIAAVLFERVELLYVFAGLNVFTFVSTIHFGPSRLLLFPFEKHVPSWLDVPAAYARSYAMTEATERFEILLRIFAVSAAIVLYGCCPIVTWMMAVGMGIFMLISTFFGFCLSALGFIAIRFFTEKCCVR